MRKRVDPENTSFVRHLRIMAHPCKVCGHPADSLYHFGLSEGEITAHAYQVGEA